MLWKKYVRVLKNIISVLLIQAIFIEILNVNISIFYTPCNLKNILTHVELFIGIWIFRFLLVFKIYVDKKMFNKSKNFKITYNVLQKLVKIKKENEIKFAEIL